MIMLNKKKHSFYITHFWGVRLFYVFVCVDKSLDSNAGEGSSLFNVE